MVFAIIMILIESVEAFIHFFKLVKVGNGATLSNDACVLVVIEYYPPDVRVVLLILLSNIIGIYGKVPAASPSEQF